MRLKHLSLAGALVAAPAVAEESHDRLASAVVFNDTPPAKLAETTTCLRRKFADVVVVSDDGVETFYLIEPQADGGFRHHTVQLEPGNEGAQVFWSHLSRPESNDSGENFYLAEVPETHQNFAYPMVSDAFFNYQPAEASLFSPQLQRVYREEFSNYLRELHADCENGDLHANRPFIEMAKGWELVMGNLNLISQRARACLSPIDLPPSEKTQAFPVLTQLADPSMPHSFEDFSLKEAEITTAKMQESLNNSCPDA